MIHRRIRPRNSSLQLGNGNRNDDDPRWGGGWRGSRPHTHLAAVGAQFLGALLLLGFALLLQLAQLLGLLARVLAQTARVPAVHLSDCKEKKQKIEKKRSLTIAVFARAQLALSGRRLIFLAGSEMLSKNSRKSRSVSIIIPCPIGLNGPHGEQQLRRILSIAGFLLLLLFDAFDAFDEQLVVCNKKMGQNGRKRGWGWGVEGVSPTHSMARSHQ